MSDLQQQYYTTPLKARSSPNDSLTRAQHQFCRSMALHGVCHQAYRKAWPGQKYRPETIMDRAEKLLKRHDIQAAIAHYRDEFKQAPTRLDWAKAKLAQERYERERRLGLGLREIDSVVDHGTPEIQARKSADVINRLSESLGRERTMAARQIAAIIEAKEIGWFSAGRWPDGTRVDVSSNSVDPLSGVPEELMAAYRGRYLPWLHEIGNEPINARLTYAGLVYDVAVNNRGLRDCETSYKLGHGTAIEHLKDALWRYAVQAGWAKLSESE